MGDQAVEEKQSETPADTDTGEVSAAPLTPDPEKLMQDAIAADPKLSKSSESSESSEDGAAPEGKKDEEDESVAQVADDTSMAPVDDPLIQALKADPRFKGSTFKTAKEFFDATHNLRTKMSQRDEDAVLGREARGSWDEFKQFKQTRQTEEQERRSWNPPPMPIGMHVELQKEADDRDPVKVEAYNKRLRYINDRQTAWAEDPDLQLQEHTLPAVQKLVGEMISQMQRRTHLEGVMKPHKSFIDKHGDEISQIMDDNVPLEYAIELAQSRHGKKPAAAAEAREADVATMASGKGKARASAASSKPRKEVVNLSDPASIIRAELAKGVVDPDPMDLD